MSRKAYSDDERKQIRDKLISTGLEFLGTYGVTQTSVENLCKVVGISKTFFYSFFPSKEEFITQVLYHQQPKLLEHAKGLMKQPDLSWRDKIKQFLWDCCRGEKSGFVVLTMKEEQAVFQRLTSDSFRVFQQKQIRIFKEVLTVFGLPVSTFDPRLFGNLVLAMIMVRKAIPEEMPFLFPEMADEMVEFQINAVIDQLESFRNPK